MTYLGGQQGNRNSTDKGGFPSFLSAFARARRSRAAQRNRAKLSTAPLPISF
jgi:hypothetical protein